MRARTGALLAAVFVTCGAPQALAAAKPVCLQVVDAAGDGMSYGGVVPHRDSLDILSADVATGARNLVGVIRLGSTTLDPTLSAGVTYAFTWRSGAVTQEFSLVQYTDGSRVVQFDPNTGDGLSGATTPAKLTVDTATSSLIFSVPRKANPALAKRGAKFSGMSVVSEPGTNLGVNQQNLSFTFNGDFGQGDGDSASSGKTYTDLAPSCVKGV